MDVCRQPVTRLTIMKGSQPR
jgi:hypothetical protein